MPLSDSGIFRAGAEFANKTTQNTGTNPRNKYVRRIVIYSDKEVTTIMSVYIFFFWNHRSNQATETLEMETSDPALVNEGAMFTFE